MRNTIKSNLHVGVLNRSRYEWNLWRSNQIVNKIYKDKITTKLT